MSLCQRILKSPGIVTLHGKSTLALTFQNVYARWATATHIPTLPRAKSWRVSPCNFFFFFLATSFLCKFFSCFSCNLVSLDVCVCVCVCLVHVLTHCTQLYTIRKHNLHGDVSLREKKHVLTNCVLANARRLSGIVIFS